MKNTKLTQQTVFIYIQKSEKQDVEIIEKFN